MPEIIQYPNAKIVTSIPTPAQQPKALPVPKAPTPAKPTNRSFILPG